MNRSIRKLTAAAAVAALVGVAPASALAETATPSATVTGTPGVAFTLGTAVTFGTTLNGTDKTPTYDLPMTVDDSRGTGAGWNVTLASTQFSTGGATPRTLAADASTLTASAVTCATGSTCTTPDNVGITYPTSVPTGVAPAVKIFGASVGFGMGKVDLKPTVQVKVPANAYEGTYSSTLTVTKAEAP
jgi:hypothetical protein